MDYKANAKNVKESIEVNTESKGIVPILSIEKKIKDRSKKWYEKKGHEYYSSDERRSYDKRYKSSKKGKEARLLSDFYIKNAIERQSKYILNRDEIPQSLIESKRQSLKLKRLIKSKSNG